MGWWGAVSCINNKLDLFFLLSILFFHLSFSFVACVGMQCAVLLMKVNNNRQGFQRSLSLSLSLSLSRLALHNKTENKDTLLGFVPRLGDAPVDEQFNGCFFKSLRPRILHEMYDFLERLLGVFFRPLEDNLVVNLQQQDPS